MGHGHFKARDGSATGRPVGRQGIQKTLGEIALLLTGSGQIGRRVASADGLARHGKERGRERTQASHAQGAIAGDRGLQSRASITS